MSYPNPIYRDYSCTLSEKNCSKLLRSLALCRASITDNFTVSSSYPEHTVNRYSMFFRLRFRCQEDLDKFHTLGLETKDIPHLNKYP